MQHMSHKIKNQKKSEITLGLADNALCFLKESLRYVHRAGKETDDEAEK